MQNSTEQLVLRLKALADPVRLRLLALCQRGECTVSELTEVMAQSQPRVSQHLKRLCDTGLLERFRDGHFVYYRVPSRGENSAARRQLLELLPDQEPVFDTDFDRLRALRAAGGGPALREADRDGLRQLRRVLIELTVSRPLGDLLDVGSGQGSILKLLASRAHRAVGVDIDADARQLARAELLLAGVANCSLRKGDMYALPFSDGEFDTVILDDVLGTAVRPMAALVEARRLLRPAGRLLLLAQARDGEAAALERRLAEWCSGAGLRLTAPRHIPSKEPRWLLAVATGADGQAEAA
ncbi:MAG: metalloregulator ArsR/SmtB family transcription factor [Woeseiaceae bacterium]|jgi:SAM-dependent methyltransferase